MVHEGEVSDFEEVEASSAESAAPSSVMLGESLSFPLKHPYSRSLTSDSPLLGQSRTFSPEDYNLSPALDYEAPYIAAKSNGPSIVSDLDVSEVLSLSPSSYAFPVKASSLSSPMCRLYAHFCRESCPKE